MKTETIIPEQHTITVEATEERPYHNTPQVLPTTTVREVTHGLIAKVTSHSYGKNGDISAATTRQRTLR